MSDTPRTDALVAQIQSTSPNNYEKVDAKDEYAYTRREFEALCNLARKLEREIASSTETLTMGDPHPCDISRAVREDTIEECAKVAERARTGRRGPSHWYGVRVEDAIRALSRTPSAIRERSDG